MAITLRTLFIPPPRCEQGIPSDRNDKYVWVDAFAPPWYISWDSLESCSVEPVRSARDVVLSSLDDTRSKGVGVWRKRTGFMPQFTGTFLGQRITSPSHTKHPEPSRPGIRRHDKFRPLIPTYETRTSEPAAAPLRFVGIQPATNVDHVLANQLSLANVHDPLHQTFCHWIGI